MFCLLKHNSPDVFRMHFPNIVITFEEQMLSNFLENQRQCIALAKVLEAMKR